MILAIDPGMRKIGWALVEADGRPQGQGILPLDGWEQALAKQVEVGKLKAVVLGDGTNRVNIEAALARLCPHAPVSVVDESESTVDAWQLKRREAAGGNVLKGLWLWLDQLINGANVDDYAARVLALRWIKAQQG